MRRGRAEGLSRLPERGFCGTRAGHPFGRTPLKPHKWPFITRYVWGKVWRRPGLSLGARRLLALAITASLGRWEEFQLHVKTWLSAELEPVDLKEGLLQVAVYAVTPAANSGFRIASDEVYK